MTIMSAAVQTKKKRILIIDDDEDVCRVLRENLAEDGYDTLSVLKGVEGVAKVGSEDFDLVILDLKLPDISGSEVLKEIRKFNENVVIVVLTGYPTIETAVETLKNAAADYILKPFNVSHLRAVVQRELAKASARPEAKLTEIPQVGERIRLLRKNKDMSLGALAEKSKLSKSYLSEVERNKKSPGLDALMSISKGLGVSVYFFFKEK